MNKSINDAIFEHAPIGIAVINGQGLFESANSEFLTTHGIKKESELIGLKAAEFPFYKQSGLDKLILGALAGRKFDKEISFTSLAGAKESFRRYLGVPVLEAGGKKAESLLLMVDDITEKRRLESDIQDYFQKLRQEQSRFLASINSLSLGFIIIDVRTNLFIKNKAVDDILGLEHEGEIFLKGDIVEIEERLDSYFNLRAHYEKCMAERKVIDLKEVVFGAKFLRIFMAPIVMLRDSNEVIGVVILIEDITEAKIIERSREEFFVIASHELRTPLTAIRGNTALIKEFYKDKIKDEEILKMISEIHDETIHLLKIVGDFLDASRLEQGKLEFKKEKFDLVALTGESISDLEKLAAAKKLYLKMEKPDAGLPLALGDKDRLKEVLSNVIGNAINYTRKGGAAVKVKKQGKFLKVLISDTGIGIQPKNQSLLFRKFQQAGEKVLSRELTRGTGLGLYISKLLIEAMGGTIELVKSEPGVGSVFAFTVPTVL